VGDPDADDVKNETFKGNLEKHVKGSNDRGTVSRQKGFQTIVWVMNCDIP